MFEFLQISNELIIKYTRSMSQKSTTVVTKCSGNDNKMVRNHRNLTFDLTIPTYSFSNISLQVLVSMPTFSQANSLSYTSLVMFKCFLIVILKDKSFLALTSDPGACDKSLHWHTCCLSSYRDWVSSHFETAAQSQLHKSVIKMAAMCTKELTQ